MTVRCFILLLAIASSACSPTDPDEVVYGTLERHRIEIPAEAYEPLIELAVTEGTHVAPGQVLARLDTTQIEARLKQARAASLQARERLNELARGSRRQEVLEARAAADAANAEFEAAAREYERLRELVTQRLVSQSQLDQQQARRDAARGAKDQAAAFKLSVQLRSLILPSRSPNELM